MKRKVKRPFDNEQFRKGYVAGIFAAEKELNTELLHFAEKAHKIMSEGTFPDYGVKINFKDSNNTITTNLDMKTEEKAKRYDEALEWMRELYPGLHGETKEDAEHYFPELKESEDERIRKELIGLISCMHDADPRKKRWIAYLEKQKEPTNEELYAEAGTTEKEYIANTMRMVRAMREKQKEQKPVRDIVPGDAIESCMLRYLQSAANRKDDIEIIADTKAYKSELISIIEKEQKPAEWKPQPESLEALMYAIEGKWEIIKPTSYLSRRLEDLYDGLVNTYNVDETLIAELPKTAYSAKDIEELKALKDKIDASMNEKPAEWSEDDEKMRDYIIHALTNNTHAKEQGPVLYAKEIAWLQSLKNRGNFPKSNTNSPSEWSEEDEAMRDNILRLLSCFVGTSECDSNPSLSTSYPAYQKEIDWLKSLRPVSKESLQPHWKPSEEQMEALSETIEFAPDTFKPKCTLVTLQYDLKKLMEE